MVVVLVVVGFFAEVVLTVVLTVETVSVFQELIIIFPVVMLSCSPVIISSKKPVDASPVIVFPLLTSPESVVHVAITVPVVILVTSFVLVVEQNHPVIVFQIRVKNPGC